MKNPTTPAAPDEATMRRLVRYAATSARLATGGRNDFRIPLMVADQWSRTGSCVLSVRTLADQFGTTRRTVCKSLNRLERAGLIRQVGRTAGGRRILEPVLQVASDGH
ncbi:MAG: helix-turn-helix domain-containing protein [Devosia sp.]